MIPPSTSGVLQRTTFLLPRKSSEKSVALNLEIFPELTCIATLEDDGGIGEFLWWQAELGAEKDFGRPASGQSHEAHAFFEVALAGQEGESLLDEGLRVQRDQVGLVLVDALVIANVQCAGLFWLERKIAEAPIYPPRSVKT